jgi:hypothetical protein
LMGHNVVWIVRGHEILSRTDIPSLSQG